MEKITKSELAKIIKEEYERAMKKQKFSQKLKSINEEIARLEEVNAGPEMDNDGVHAGQATPEFDMKGSHLVEDGTIEEGFEKDIAMKGNDIYFIDHKVGSIVDGQPVLDPAYPMVNTPAVIAKIKSLYQVPTVPAVADPNPAGVPTAEPVVAEETEFESASADSDTGFTSAPVAQQESKKGNYAGWMFEGRDRMLKLGGLLTDEN